MKLFILSILIFILLFHSTSCNRKEEQKDILLYAKDINFKRPLNEPDFNYVRYSENDSSSMIVVANNRYANTHHYLFLYDMKTGDTIESIRIPHKIKMSGFNYKNKDTIYFTQRYSAKLFMMDHNSQIKDTLLYITGDGLIDFLYANKLGISMEFIHATLAPLIIEDTVVFINNLSDPIRDPAQQFLLLVFHVGKDTVTVNSSTARFPAHLLHKDKTLYPYTFLIYYDRNNSGQTVVSFSPDHNLYLYSNDSLIRSIECKSKYIDDLPGFIDKKDINDEKLIKRRTNNLLSYTGVYYDKYNDLYIRTGKITPCEKNEDGFVDYKKYKYTIMVIDNNFNIISEQVFNSIDYEERSLLITRDGIMLKKPDDLSGITRYSLFKYNPEYFNKDDIEDGKNILH